MTNHTILLSCLNYFPSPPPSVSLFLCSFAFLMLITLRGGPPFPPNKMGTQGVYLRVDI